MPFELRMEPDEAMFPASWRQPRIDAQASALPLQHREHAREAIHRAMSKYPEHVLERIEAVYLLGDIHCFGVEYGATRSSRRLYISASGLTEENIRHTIEYRFHGEFSSILFSVFRHRFDASQWKAANPDGFEYTGSGIAAVRAGRSSLIWYAHTVHDGFLCAYSKASIDNDFDVIVAEMFTGRRDLWEVYARVDGIRQKVDLVIDFYQQVDSAFSEQYFRQLAANGF